RIGQGTMSGPRVLVANEHRAYRDAFASLVRTLRPVVDVVLADPDRLDDAIVAHAPDLVVCSRITEHLLAHAPSWIVLYPDGAALVVTSVAGRRRTLPDLDVSHLLALVDEAIRRTQVPF